VPSHVAGSGPRRSAAYPLSLLIACAILLAISAVHPYDTATWWMEVFPIFLAVPVLVATYRRFPLTRLVYTLIFIHACILMLGGHYSYARVPLGFWIQDLFHFSRNHYDRIGHFAQGFIPAIIAREILVRRSPLRPGAPSTGSGQGWLFFLVCCVCLAVSAMYEFVEWWAALIGGSGATEFLGTQGDVWDTQWDMFMALVGAITAQVALSRLHDRQMRALGGAGNPSIDTAR
jgi:putative membrane protein